MQNPANNDKPTTTSAATTPAASMTPATGPATPPRRRRATKAATTTRNATKAAADTPSPRGRKKDAPAATTVRRVVQGDTPPNLGKQALENFVTEQSIQASQGKKIEALSSILDNRDKKTFQERAKALRAILEGASPDDRVALRTVLKGKLPKKLKNPAINPDEELADDWRDGGYPYKNLLRRSTYV